MRGRMILAAGLLLLVGAACQPRYGQGWYPIIGETGAVIAGVDSPETARRNGLEHRTIVRCNIGGWWMATTLAQADTLGSHTWCEPAVVRNGVAGAG